MKLQILNDPGLEAVAEVDDTEDLLVVVKCTCKMLSWLVQILAVVTGSVCLHWYRLVVFGILQTCLISS